MIYTYCHIEYFIKPYKYKFNGKELDNDTGLYYYGARYYDPRVSNWLSVDPIALWQPIQETEHYIEGQHNGGVFNAMNLNVYGYCYQNPVLYLDPNGKQVNSQYFYNQEFNRIGARFKYLIQKPFLYEPTRVNGKIVIDNNWQATKHYYRGNGESVMLGPKTQDIIRNSQDINYYRSRIEKGLTTNPAEGSNLSVNMENEKLRTYHIGETTMSYSTLCNSTDCTTTYTISGDGVWDIFWGDDKKGSKGELGGTPYDYLPFSWEETYKNPGYEMDKNGKPLPIKDKMTEGKGTPNSNSSSY